MLQPQVDVATWISLACIVISRDLIVSAVTSFLVTALINGRDIVCSRDLIYSVFLQCLCRDLTVMSQPLCLSLLPTSELRQQF